MKARHRVHTAFLLCCIMSAVYIGMGIARADDKDVRLLSLEECIRYAARNSFEVKLARIDYLIAQTDKGIAQAVFDGNLFSNINYEDDQRKQLSVFASHSLTVDYEGGITKTLPIGTEITAAVSDTRSWTNTIFNSQNPAHTVEASFEGRQPISKNFFGVNDRRSITLTQLSIQNADLGMQERIEVFLSDVEKAYWKWVYTKERLNIFREILAKAEELRRRNEQNYDVGRIEKADLLASQANVSIRERDVRLAENDYRREEENLKLLMNIDAAKRFDPARTLKHTYRSVTLKESLQKAFEKRRDYIQAKRDIEIEDITVKIKSNERWPEVDLVGTLAANGIHRRFDKAVNKYSGDNAYFAGGVEVTVPLENNEAKAAYQEAAYNKEKAILELKNVERVIVTEVGDAVRDYQTFQSTLKHLIEAADLQREKLQEEEKRYAFGRSDTKRLIDYQQDSLNANLLVATGIHELEVARIDLEKTVNTILKKYEGIL